MAPDGIGMEEGLEQIWRDVQRQVDIHSQRRRAPERGHSMTLQILAMMMQQGQVNPLSPAYNESVSIWRQVSGALHLSMYRVLSLLVAVLPGILACLVALLVFTLIGAAVSAFLRWLLRRHQVR